MTKEQKIKEVVKALDRPIDIPVTNYYRCMYCGKFEYNYNSAKLHCNRCELKNKRSK